MQLEVVKDYYGKTLKELRRFENVGVLRRGARCRRTWNGSSRTCIRR